MTSQTVFRLISRTGFSGLQAFKEPIPVPSAHELLIKIRSVALNYRDTAIATSKAPFPVKDNLIPCSDMAGEVVQTGDLVKGFAIGDEVVAPINLSLLYGPCKDLSDTFGGAKDGVLREYIALPAHAIIKLPKSAHSFEDWAAIITTGSTVWNAFYGNTPLKPGDTVLVLGTGGVSVTALIFAKAAGATTIVTSSSDTKLEYVKSNFGADYTVNYKTHPNWSAEVQRITNGQGVNHIIEIGGGATMQQSLESVAIGGTISVIGFLGGVSQDKLPDVTRLALMKACVVRGILGGSKQQLEEAVRFVASRELLVPVDKTFTFTRDDIIAALGYVASGEHIGKVCIKLD
ncbi:NAD(P)-binding protein [Stipitochalara longipes BDJ]|nr:NAD(P)-binding protein [Stipitochalara longipes BDJ]